MRLKRINEDSPWAAYAETAESGECSLQQQLADLAANPKTSAYVSGFLVLLDAIPPNGPWQLGVKLYHCVDEANEIYQFTKGPYRLLCFHAEARMVVCSHLFRKTGQKAPKAEVAKAIALRRRYLAAATVGEIEFVEE